MKWTKATEALPPAGSEVKMKWADGVNEFFGDPIKELRDIRPKYYENLLWWNESESTSPEPLRAALEKVLEKLEGGLDWRKNNSGRFEQIREGVEIAKKALASYSVSDKITIGEWQLCPKCHGQKSVSKPPYVAAEVTEWSSSATSFQCDMCNGDGKLLKPIIKSGASGDEQGEVWKSIDKDGYPEYNRGVLVCIPGEDYHVTSGMWDVSNKWVLLDDYRKPDCEITHYMPLPALPKEFQEEVKKNGEVMQALSNLMRKKSK